MACCCLLVRQAVPQRLLRPASEKGQSPRHHASVSPTCSHLRMSEWSGDSACHLSCWIIGKKSRCRCLHVLSQSQCERILDLRTNGNNYLPGGFLCGIFWFWAGWTRRQQAHEKIQRKRWTAREFEKSGEREESGTRGIVEKVGEIKATRKVQMRREAGIGRNAQDA